MEPQIRYARTTDGVRIAYTRVGSGPPVLYCDFGLRFQALLAANFLLNDVLSSCARVTYLDQGGCGASDRDVTDMSAEAMVRATEAVVAACMQDERFTLIARIWACPSAALYATAHPDRVERLICIGPSHSMRQPEVVRTDWSMYRRLMATWVLPDGPVERQRWWGQAVRDSFSQAAWIAMAEAYEEIDQISVFERVRVPTLFIGDAREAFRQHATRLAAAVDDARLIMRDGTGPMDDDRAVVLACLEFMGIEGALANEATRGDTALILFADIVDSTALTERLGDAAFRSAARILDDRMRTAIRVAGGSAIEGKLLGDGVLAVFTSAANAIDAALACARACDGTGLQLHLGLHAGDVIREEGNVFGGAVNIASRISALSAPGEVLVSRTVADLARTSAGVVFEDRGEHALKGVGDAVRVYAVKTRL
ncbi:MAG: adenylate/guanylate cyclase domain-containing protein [Chloroflexota bacterium]|nr:adenylate/guanylate cyclase domain-containing protein [Chloroflexota bacterium]